jgi:hypothetical protein
MRIQCVYPSVTKHNFSYLCNGNDVIGTHNEATVTSSSNYAYAYIFKLEYQNKRPSKHYVNY